MCTHTDACMCTHAYTQAHMHMRLQLGRACHPPPGTMLATWAQRRETALCLWARGRGARCVAERARPAGCPACSRCSDVSRKIPERIRKGFY